MKIIGEELLQELKRFVSAFRNNIPEGEYVDEYFAGKFNEYLIPLKGKVEGIGRYEIPAVQIIEKKEHLISVHVSEQSEAFHRALDEFVGVRSKPISSREVSTTKRMVRRAFLIMQADALLLYLDELIKSRKGLKHPIGFGK
jgi:hypothetical protein